MRNTYGTLEKSDNSAITSVTNFWTTQKTEDEEGIGKHSYAMWLKVFVTSSACKHFDGNKSFP